MLDAVHRVRGSARDARGDARAVAPARVEVPPGGRVGMDGVVKDAFGRDVRQVQAERDQAAAKWRTRSYDGGCDPALLEWRRSLMDR